MKILENFVMLLDKLIVIGDRVLVKPKSIPDKTRTGLFLPPGYNEKEMVQSGYIVKCGPGIPIPFPNDNDVEPWMQQTVEPVKYIPLQAQIGDLAIFLQKSAIEIMYNNEKYFIVPHSSILLLEREEL